MAEKNSESTAVNQLIELVATAKPLPPDPSEDLMFREVKKPSARVATGTQQGMRTLPPARPTSARPTSARATAVGPTSARPGQTLKAMPLGVRLATATPSRATPPLTLDHEDEETEVTNPGPATLSRATSQSMPASSAAVAIAAAKPIGTSTIKGTAATFAPSAAVGSAPANRPTKPILPPPHPTIRARASSPSASSPSASRPSASSPSASNPPASNPPAIPAEPGFRPSSQQTSDFAYPLDAVPPQPAGSPSMAHPKAMPAVAPETLDDEPYDPIASILEPKMIRPEIPSAASPSSWLEADIGTQQVPKRNDWKAIVGRLVGPMVVLVIVGIFVGGYFAFDGDGGKQRAPNAASTPEAVAAKTAAGSTVAGAAKPDTAGSTVAGAAKPDTAGSTVAGAAKPDTAGSTVAGAAKPDTAGSTVAGGAKPDAAGSTVAGGAKPDAAGSTVAGAAKADAPVVPPNLASSTITTSRTAPATTNTATTNTATTNTATTAPATAPATTNTATTAPATAPATTNTATTTPATTNTATTATTNTATTAPATATTTTTTASSTPGTRPVLVDIRIDSTPSGATVTLIDRGKSTYLGTTPVSAAVDTARKYELVVSYENRATVVQPLDPATTKKVSVKLGRAGAKASASAPPRPRTVAKPAKPAKPEAVEVERPAVDKAPPRPDADKPAASGGEGTLMISSKPPCEIVIDGKPTGLTTPQRAIALPAGAHKITLVNTAEGIKKTVSVQITADKATKVIQDLMK